MQVHDILVTGNGEGVLDIDFGQDLVDRHTSVLANICELSQPEGGPLDFPFIGGASMEVRNIAPQDDGHVLFWVEVNWDSSLNSRMRVFIF